MATKSSGSSEPSGSSADQIFESLLNSDVNEPKINKPKPGLDEAIQDIYQQAHNHRSVLVRFYITYTVFFSLAVASLVFFQVQARLIPGQEQLEIVPQWVLYLLVGGMFAQFISLLTIVTKKVWTFEPFFKYYDSHKK